ncbi:unnamed protein product [Soboliphyme baturini]|uniref:Secreted protein n=1 Tax=Soboliphyme baturini TaxID=241478 RepID=A0A183IXQ8_9BILA|nr:unnamed protein product [Soboliphyme baturini]
MGGVLRPGLSLLLDELWLRPMLMIEGYRPPAALALWLFMPFGGSDDWTVPMFGLLTSSLPYRSEIYHREDHQGAEEHNGTLGPGDTTNWVLCHDRKAKGHRGRATSTVKQFGLLALGHLSCRGHSCNHRHPHPHPRADSKRRDALLLLPQSINFTGGFACCCDVSGDP